MIKFDNNILELNIESVKLRAALINLTEERRALDNKINIFDWLDNFDKSMLIQDKIFNLIKRGLEICSLLKGTSNKYFYLAKAILNEDYEKAEKLKIGITGEM